MSSLIYRVRDRVRVGVRARVRVRVEVKPALFSSSSMERPALFGHLG